MIHATMLVGYALMVVKMDTTDRTVITVRYGQTPVAIFGVNFYIVVNWFFFLRLLDKNWFKNKLQKCIPVINIGIYGYKTVQVSY